MDMKKMDVKFRLRLYLPLSHFQEMLSLIILPAIPCAIEKCTTTKLSKKH